MSTRCRHKDRQFCHKILPLNCLEHSVRSCFGHSSSRDERARALTQLQQAVTFELRVRLDYGVRTDDELLGKGSDAGQGVARLQYATLNRVTDLLNELQIQRLTA